MSDLLSDIHVSASAIVRITIDSDTAEAWRRFNPDFGFTYILQPNLCTKRKGS